MGIYHRDYVREDLSSSPFQGDTPVCQNIIILTTVVFVLQILFQPHVDHYLAMNSSAVLQGQIWRVITYGFCHDIYSLFHILFNMLGIWWFGPSLEKIYGSREFLWFYLLSIVGAGLFALFWSSLIVNFMQVPAMNLIGASGGVLAVLTLFACYFPDHRIGLFFGLIFVEARWIVVIYAVFSIFPMLHEINQGKLLGGTAHAAHLMGIVFALGYYRRQWRLAEWNRWLSFAALSRWWKNRQRRRALKVYVPPQVLDENEMDRILAKISEVGEANITPAERAFLERASQELRKRF